MPLTLHGPQMIFVRLEEKIDDKRELKEELYENGRGFDADSGCAHLLHLVSRQDRGLLDYEKCTYEELLKFCARRGISASISRGKGKKKTTLVTNVLANHLHISQFTRRQLISALEKADEEISLPGFFQVLPAELRCRVYNYSFAYFDLPEHDPCRPPPITQASQLARQESLPLFYQFHELSLQFDGLQGPGGKLVGLNTRTFLDSLPHLAKLYRHVKLNAQWSLGGSLFDLTRSRWKISMDIQGNAYTITLREGLDWHSHGLGLEKVIKETDADIRKMFGEIASRAGEEQAIELEKEDWVALEDIFIRAHSQYNRSLAGNA